jgi:RNA polymerase sigma-70 factor (ECF subfamily)
MTEVKPDSEETTLLLQQVHQGEPGFERLFDRHRAAVREVIRLRLDGRLRSRFDLSDVLQETEFEAYRRMPDYLERRPMPFHLWLRKTAQERVLMLRRRHGAAAARSVDRELPLPENSSVALAQHLAVSQTTPSAVLNEQELAARVRQAVADLPEADREVLLMRTYEELSYNEIACILEIEPAAARKRHGRALIRLHQLLTAGGLTESQL